MGKFIDLTGRKFGKLTVIGRSNKPGGGVKPTWSCECACGNTVVVNGSNLRSGNSTTCGINGCGQTRGVSVGDKYGRLTVLKQDGVKRHGKSCFSAWECLCECGVITRVIGISLKSGKTRSCGCLLSESAAINGQKSAKDLTGQKFGFLEVIARATPPGTSHSIKWLCCCECGTLAIVNGNSIVSGRTVS